MRPLACKVPVVDLCNFIPDLPAVRVRNDATALGREAAGHLLERRFRRLMHVGRKAWPRDNNYLVGFESRAAEEGVPVQNLMLDIPPLSERYGARGDGALTWTARDYWEFVQDTARQLAGDLAQPVAVFSQTALFAMDLIDALTELGVLVPEQVAVLAIWERPDISSLSSIPLSSIQEDTDAQGYRAAGTLDRMMRDEPVPQVQWITPRPVVTLESTDTLAMSDLCAARALKHFREHAYEVGFAPKVAAQDLGVTVRTLQRWFDQHVGQSPTDYIARRRIHRAVDLIMNGKLNLTTAIQRAGFSDYQQLKRALWKHLQCTPRSLLQNSADLPEGHRPTQPTATVEE